MPCIFCDGCMLIIHLCSIFPEMLSHTMAFLHSWLLMNVSILDIILSCFTTMSYYSFIFCCLCSFLVLSNLCCCCTPGSIYVFWFYTSFDVIVISSLTSYLLNI